ncbi:filamentous hemagglutinin N-terminal domain-containing protein [Enterobacter sp.]|uniref:filamentous hemagglutinin N-terminal domain-containing protein n=1 Tax=Enterobacter sp. TaxID=42895 RepID=UPI00296EB707|nr:filamentous hemagglutinin N-terminal domain-containing protein [Enterobacter sp.]
MKTIKKDKITESNLHLRLAPLYLSLASIFSPLAEAAGTVPDPRQPDGPTMGKTANDTPMVNIVNPNAKGVSHNKFDQFNVDKKGMVFNNSKTDGVTKIGGYAVKNGHLQQEASAIISEVTGAQASYINGTMEVFGKKSDIIIANENGISVNGATTINANGLTLSTGKVQAKSDGTYSLSVEKGNVTLTGQGISTDGLSYFDIVSRSAQLEGEIAGAADVKVLAGQNDYNLQTRSHTVRNKGDATTPAVAIDGSALGSMYGGKIQLISTESGAGVRHAGGIVASKDIDINANGDVILTGLRSDKNITLAGNNVTLNKSTGITAQANIAIKALAGVTLNSDVISQSGTLRIDASSLVQNAATLLTNSTTMTAIPAIEINVENEYILTGKLKALDAKGNVIGNGTVTLKDGDFVVMVNGKPAPFSAIISDAQVVSHSGNININAGSVKNSEGVMLAKKGTLQINLKKAFENNGSVSATGSVAIASGSMKNNGIMYATDTQTLTVGDVDNSGRVFADKKLVMNASALNNKGNIGVSHGEMQLTTRDNLVNSATISGDDARLTLNAGGNLDNSGTIVSNKNDVALNVNGKSVNNKGKIQARDVTITATDASAEMTNSGTISGKKDVQVNVARLNNDGGSLSAASDITVNVDKEMINTRGGEILAEKAMAINGKAGMSVTNASDGWIQGQTITTNATSLYNTSAAVILAENSLNLANLDTLINEGATIQAASLNLENIAELENTHAGTIYASDTLNISAVDSLLNDNAILSSGGVMSLADIGSLTNSNNAFLSSTAAMTLSGITTFNNQSQIVSDAQVTIENSDTLKNEGIIQAGTDLTIRNIHSLVNQGSNHVLSAMNNLTLDHIGAVTNTDRAVISASVNTVLNAIGTMMNSASGIVQAIDGTLNITADTINNSGTESTIVAGGDVTLTANQLTNDDHGAIVAVDKNLTLNIADSLTNTKNATLAGYNVNLASGSLSNTAGGFITADRDLNLDLAHMNNTGGAMEAANTLTLEIDDDLTLNNENGHILSGNDLNFITHGSFTNNKELEVMGDFTARADKNVINTQSIVTGGDLTLTAANITNAQNALLWSIGDMSLDARNGNVYNALQGNVMSMGDMSIIAKNIENAAGIIRAEKNINLDAEQIKNISKYSGGTVSGGTTENSHGHYATVTNVTTKINMDTVFSLPLLTSDLTLEHQAEISAGGILMLISAEYILHTASLTKAD